MNLKGPAKPPPPETDAEVLRQAQPFIRTAMAFIMYIRGLSSAPNIDTCYRNADTFLVTLERDIKERDER